MLSAILEKLRSEALRLSQPERAELADELVKSLDAPADADAAEAWEKEILRRLAEVESDTATLIDREELRRRMRAATSCAPPRLRSTYEKDHRKKLRGLLTPPRTRARRARR